MPAIHYYIFPAPLCFLIPTILWTTIPTKIEVIWRQRQTLPQAYLGIVDCLSWWMVCQVLEGTVPRADLTDHAGLPTDPSLGRQTDSRQDMAGATPRQLVGRASIPGQTKTIVHVQTGTSATQA